MFSVIFYIILHFCMRFATYQTISQKIQNLYLIDLFASIAPCPSPPPLVENGIRLFIGQEHGRRARYICANGFRLMGMGQNMPYLICDKGKWIGGNPVCEER